MIVGVPKEIKPDEYRISLTPAGAKTLVSAGHKVLIEKGAGEGTWISDEEYINAGATIVNTNDVWADSEVVVKVKEPQESEFGLIKPSHILFTYFHFASSRSLTDAMVKSQSCCIAYETVVSGGTHPLLTPMSEVAGRLSIQQGAKYLEKPMGGRGVMLSGVPGVKPGVVTIIGAGVVGVHAAKIAAGFGATVYVLDVNMDRLRYVSEIFPSNVMGIYSDSHSIQKCISDSDLVVGAVYLTGAKAPMLVDKDMIKCMKPGSVVVDVCVDQGGCFETTRPTTHQNPVYTVENVIHYAVTNMPGAVANTSTYALTNATFPHLFKVAQYGLMALNYDASLKSGLDIAFGKVMNKSLSDLFDYSLTNVEDVLLAS